MFGLELVILLCEEQGSSEELLDKGCSDEGHSVKKSGGFIFFALVNIKNDQR